MDGSISMKNPRVQDIYGENTPPSIEGPALNMPIYQAFSLKSFGTYTKPNSDLRQTQYMHSDLINLPTIGHTTGRQDCHIAKPRREPTFPTLFSALIHRVTTR